MTKVLAREGVWGGWMWVGKIWLLLIKGVKQISDYCWSRREGEFAIPLFWLTSYVNSPLYILFGTYGLFWSYFGIMLCLFWGFFVFIFVLFCVVFLDYLGKLWGYFEGILGCYFGVILIYFGVILIHFGFILVSLSGLFGDFSGYLFVIC